MKLLSHAETECQAQCPGVECESKHLHDEMTTVELGKKAGVLGTETGKVSMIVKMVDGISVFGTKMTEVGI